VPGATDAWVMNFTTRKTDYPWPKKSSSVRCVHIWHDLQWKNAALTFDDDRENAVEVKLHSNHLLS